MATRIVKRPERSAIAEHDLVRLRSAVATEEGLVAASEIGTVVHIHGGAEAFEVEFDAPVHVVTIMAELVERVPV